MTQQDAHQVSEWAISAAKDARMLREKRAFIRASRMERIVRQYADALISYGQSVEQTRKLFCQP